MMFKSTSKHYWVKATTIVLIVSLALSIYGCSAINQDKTEIRLAIDNNQYAEKWKELLDLFNETNKTYCIRTVVYDGNEFTVKQLEEELIEGTAPDILALSKDTIPIQYYSDDIRPYLQKDNGETIELLPFYSNTLSEGIYPYKLPLAIWCDTRIFYEQNQEVPDFYPLQGINSVWHLKNLYGESYSFDMNPNSSYFVFAPMELEICVYSSGKHKDGVQAFLQYMLQDDNQLFWAGYDRFPVTKSAFDLLCEKSILGEVFGGNGFQLAESDIAKLKGLFENTWIQGKWMD